MFRETISECPYTKVFKLLGPVDPAHITKYHNKRHQILQSSTGPETVSGLRLGGTTEFGFYFIRPYSSDGRIRRDLSRLSWITAGQEQGTIAICLDPISSRQVVKCAELGDTDLKEVLKSAQRINDSWVAHRQMILLV